jgi:ParB/RepB/Spo0J family partition protein
MLSDLFQFDSANPTELRGNPNNIRKSADSAEDSRLVESIKALGVLQPPGIMPDSLIAWGNRRVSAAVVAGLKTIPIIRLKKMVTETEFLLLQFTENDVRAGLSDRDIYLACKEMRRLNPGWTNADLAPRIQKDASMLTRIFSVDKLIPAARHEFLAGAFGFSIAYEISKAASEQEQHQRLADRLAGSSRTEMTQAARKIRTAATAHSSAKANRIRCILPSGFQIVVSGDCVTLESAAEALAEVIREMKRAKELGYTAKTFAAAMADKARK